MSQKRTVRVYCAGKISHGNDWRPHETRRMSGGEYDNANAFGVELPSIAGVEVIYVGPFAYGCDHGCSHGPTTHGNGLRTREIDVGNDDGPNDEGGSWICQESAGETPVGPVAIRLEDGRWLGIGNASSDTLRAARESGSPMACTWCRLDTRNCRCGRRVVYERSLEQIDRADLVIARPEVDSYGTLLEIGYAVASKKQIVVDLYGQRADLAAELWFAAQAHRCTDHVLEDIAIKILGHGPEKWGAHAKPADRPDPNEALCESPIEVALYRAMRSAGLHPTPQVEIGRYRADFIIDRFVIECDGHDFHSSREQRTSDAERDRALMAAGYQVIRFTGTEIHRDASRCARDVRNLVTPAATR